MHLHCLPSLTDNYIWVLETDGGSAWAVDPGHAPTLERLLEERHLKLEGLLITHHHHDHVDGIPSLKARFSPTVLGPDEAIRGVDIKLVGGESLDLPGVGQVEVIATPGHTLGHLAYYLPAAGLLFCGDTLFSAGCGRLFEDTPAQMYHSLQQLAALPGSTRVCCAHEYTTANLHFAATVEPDNALIRARLETVNRLRAEGRPSVPTSLAEEQDYNPFLRTDVPAVIAHASQHAGKTLAAGQDTFAALRDWKDHFSF